jgi:tetrathionate reductase subunit B
MKAESTPAACGSTRRSLLIGAAGLGAIVLAPGVMLYSLARTQTTAQPFGRAADSHERWGLLIDLNKCPPDCDVCVSACQTENGWKIPVSETDPQWIRKVRVRNPEFGGTRELPVMCQHCAKPPCVDVCPTGASFKRADGIVLVDKHICIGCRYCMMACPYKARSFVHEPLENQKPHAPRGKGTVESCTLCVHRIDTGRIPACVEACAAKGGGAMVFGDLGDPASDIFKAVARHGAGQIRADLELDSSVRYAGLSGTV